MVDFMLWISPQLKNKKDNVVPSFMCKMWDNGPMWGAGILYVGEGRLSEGHSRRQAGLQHTHPPAPHPST